MDWNGIGGITGDGVEEIYGRKFIENHMENYDYQIEKTYTILKSIKQILDSIGCKYRIKNFPQKVTVMAQRYYLKSLIKILC